MITPTQSDAGLLERFSAIGEDSAFTELVERHGPRVWRVCRRFLPNEHDAEEVFQATFLLLARKARTVCWHGSIDGWLCAAARRLALHSRATTSRRRLRESPFVSLRMEDSQADADDLPERFHPVCDPLEEIHRRDATRLLHGALRQLPEKYKAALELCYLEGKTNEEAARQLGWPAGSMSRRLQRARDLLRHRLVHMILIFVLCASGAVYAFMRIKPDVPSSRVGNLALISSMRAFRTPHDGQGDLEAVLRRISRDGQATQSREQLEALSRTAQWVAGQTANEKPARRAEFWTTQVDAMRLAAVDLGRAATAGDRLAVVDAVRRLDATCLACHEVFRP